MAQQGQRERTHNIMHDYRVQLPTEVNLSAEALLWENWQMLVQLVSQINFNLGICFVFFSQTVILISENHKFIHLPFSLEVKCEGFRTEQASTSVTCQRAAEQKHIGIVSNTDIYIYLNIYMKKKIFLTL